jgi:hypothetical protein
MVADVLMAFFLVCVSAPVHSNISFESPFWTTLQPRALFPLLKRAIQTHSRRTREAAVGRGIDRHLLGLKLMLEELPPDTPSSLDSPSTSGSSRLTNTPAAPREIRTHPLFTDPLFTRSQEWKLSTSALNAGYHFRGTGFGAVFPDGYGINCEFKLSFSESLCGIFVGGRPHRPELVYFLFHSRSPFLPNRAHTFSSLVDLIAPDRIRFCIESKFSSPLTSTSRFKQYIEDALLDLRAICEAGLDPADEPELKNGQATGKEAVGGVVDVRVQARL